MKSKDQLRSMPEASNALQLRKAPRFTLGCVVMTHGAMNSFADALTTPEDLLERHASGDWGERL
jgi:hypothetical protein